MFFNSVWRSNHGTTSVIPRLLKWDIFTCFDVGNQNLLLDPAIVFDSWVLTYLPHP